MQAYQMLTMLYRHRLGHIVQPVWFNIQAFVTLEHSILGVAFQWQVFQFNVLPSSLSLTGQRNNGTAIFGQWAPLGLH